MRRYLVPAVMAALLSLFWLMLSGVWLWYNWIIGFLLSLLVLIIFNQMHRGERILSGRTRRPYIWAFIFYLLGQIYLAGISTIRRIFTNDISPGLVQIETDLESDLAISVLASAITMTPGTVTVARKENKLTVLWIDCKTEDPKEAGPLIKKKLEKLLMEK